MVGKSFLKRHFLSSKWWRNPKNKKGAFAPILLVRVTGLTASLRSAASLSWRLKSPFALQNVKRCRQVMRICYRKAKTDTVWCPFSFGAGNRTYCFATLSGKFVLAAKVAICFAKRQTLQAGSSHLLPQSKNGHLLVSV